MQFNICFSMEPESKQDIYNIYNQTGAEKSSINFERNLKISQQGQHLDDPLEQEIKKLEQEQVLRNLLITTYRQTNIRIVKLENTIKTNKTEDLKNRELIRQENKELKQKIASLKKLACACPALIIVCTLIFIAISNERLQDLVANNN